jgi:hypothetical protein
MPTGWSVTTTPGASSGCLAQIPSTTGLQKTSVADISFNVDGNNGNFEEELVTFSGSSQKAFSVVVAGFNACHNFNTTSAGLRWTGTYRQMSFPVHGIQSAAFSGTFHSSQGGFNYVVLVGRLGNIVMVVSETYQGVGSLGQPNLGQFENYVTTAVAKVHGQVINTVTVPTSSTTTSSTAAPAPTVPPTTSPPTTASGPCTPSPTTAQSAPPCGSASVPNVTGQELDQAEATLVANGLGYKVIGGGTFGVVIASDWTVCSQSPSAGVSASSVNLVVARSCT